MIRMLAMFLLCMGSAASFGATAKIYDHSDQLKYIIETSGDTVTYYDSSYSKLGEARCSGDGSVRFYDRHMELQYIERRDDHQCVLSSAITDLLFSRAGQQ